jgi:hypothetical protein
VSGTGVRIIIIPSETVEVRIRKGQGGRLAHSCGLVVLPVAITMSLM